MENQKHESETVAAREASGTRSIGISAPQPIAIQTLALNALKGFRKFYWLFFLIISVLSSYFYIRAERSYVPLYQAHMSFAVNTQSAYGYSESYYNQVSVKKIGSVFPYILESGLVQQKVQERMNIPSLNASISSSVLEESAVFTINVGGSDPEHIYEVLTNVVDCFPEVARYVIGNIQLSVIDDSGVPKTPINPPNFKSLAKRGAMMGAAISALLLLLYALSRNTVTRSEDLERYISMPFLGGIPKIRAGIDRKTGKKLSILLDEKGSMTALGESLRIIRTRFMRQAEERNMKKIVITSTAPGEGKSTIAVNFAVSLAREGKSVILVDGDLRNPTVRTAMHLTGGTAGFADVLNGTAELGDALVPYKDENIMVLPGNLDSVDPAGLLGNERMKELFEALGKAADFLIGSARQPTT